MKNINELLKNEFEENDDYYILSFGKDLFKEACIIIENFLLNNFEGFNREKLSIEIRTVNQENSYMALRLLKPVGLKVLYEDKEITPYFCNIVDFENPLELEVVSLERDEWPDWEEIEELEIEDLFDCTEEENRLIQEAIEEHIQNEVYRTDKICLYIWSSHAV